MTKQDINQQIDNLNKLKAETLSNLREFVNDQSISLDDRWNVFISSGYGDTSDRTNFDLDRDDSFLYDSPLYMDKYSTMDVSDILKGLKEDEDFGLIEDEEVIFKEYCLSNFCIKMTFSW